MKTRETIKLFDKTSTPIERLWYQCYINDRGYFDNEAMPNFLCHLNRFDLISSRLFIALNQNSGIQLSSHFLKSLVIKKQWTLATEILQKKMKINQQSWSASTLFLACLEEKFKDINFNFFLCTLIKTEKTLKKSLLEDIEISFENYENFLKILETLDMKEKNLAISWLQHLKIKAEDSAKYIEFFLDSHETLDIDLLIPLQNTDSPANKEHREQIEVLLKQKTYYTATKITLAFANYISSQQNIHPPSELIPKINFRGKINISSIQLSLIHDSESFIRLFISCYTYSYEEQLTLFKSNYLLELNQIESSTKKIEAIFQHALEKPNSRTMHVLRFIAESIEKEPSENLDTKLYRHAKTQSNSFFWRIVRTNTERKHLNI